MTLRDLTREQIAEAQAICKAAHRTAKVRWGNATPTQDKVWELAFSRGLELGLSNATKIEGLTLHNFPNTAP